MEILAMDPAAERAHTDERSERGKADSRGLCDLRSAETAHSR